VLQALLKPIERLDAYEREGDFFSRLVLQEEIKSMQFSTVWDAYCTHKGVPLRMDFMAGIKGYEKSELAGRE
jgi:L-rhamnose isomerase